MFNVMKTPKADTRTCDYTNVTERELYLNSMQHCADVARGVQFLCQRLGQQGDNHDLDKRSTGMRQHFHRCFLTGFKDTTWLDNHYRVSRHHLQVAEGIPENVNLLDVLECAVDIVVTGLAGSGEVRPIDISNEVLQRALQNTVKLLIDNAKLYRRRS